MLDPKEIKNVGIYYLKKRNIGLRGEDGAGESSIATEGKGSLRALVPWVCTGQKAKVDDL